MSLKQNLEKIKGYWNNYSQVIFLLCSAILAVADVYMLGFISNYDKKPSLDLIYDENLNIDEADLNKKESIVEMNNEGKTILASKNGTKYYFLWCSGAGRIKEENKIYFGSEEAARVAGYEIAKGCEE